MLQIYSLHFHFPNNYGNNDNIQKKGIVFFDAVALFFFKKNVNLQKINIQKYQIKKINLL